MPKKEIKEEPEVKEEVEKVEAKELEKKEIEEKEVEKEEPEVKEEVEKVEIPLAQTTAPTPPPHFIGGHKMDREQIG